jgi:adenylosuccinate synthase
MDKTGRNGLRIGDITLPDFRQRYETLKEKHLGLLKMYPDVDFDLADQENDFFAAIDIIRGLRLVNGEYYINNALSEGKKILAEGAQGSMLDIDFGTYPFVTSSNTISAGVCSGLGIAPNKIKEVIGIAKAYCTRVGSGPFPTELLDETGEKLRSVGHEFGATTGRPRRCGWIDIPQLKYTIMLNGVSQVIITKLDVLDSFEDIRVCTAYQYENLTTEELPFDMTGFPVVPLYEQYAGWNESLDSFTEFDAMPDLAREYIRSLEKHLKTNISMVSTGPERHKLFSL